MQNFVNIFATVLAVCLLKCIAAQHSKEIYTMDINERGSRFNESIEVDEEQQTVVYHVPEHNNASESRVLVDYKAKISVTLVPKLKECYIRKLLSNNKEPSPSETKRNMQMRQLVAEYNVDIPVEKKTDVMIKIREIQPEKLSRKVFEFCGGYPVFLVKDVPVEQVLALSKTKEGFRLQKRSTTLRLVPMTYNQARRPASTTLRLVPMTYNQARRLASTTLTLVPMTYNQARRLANALESGVYTCNKMSTYSNALSTCATDSSKTIKYGCGLKRGPTTCRYTAICEADQLRTDPPKENPHGLKSFVNVEIKCKEDHKFTILWCCDIICV